MRTLFYSLVFVIGLVLFVYSEPNINKSENITINTFSLLVMFSASMAVIKPWKD